MRLYGILYYCSYTIPQYRGPRISLKVILTQCLIKSGVIQHLIMKNLKITTEYRKPYSKLRMGSALPTTPIHQFQSEVFPVCISKDANVGLQTASSACESVYLPPPDCLDKFA